MPSSRRSENARRATAELPRSRWSATSPRPRRCKLPAVWKRADTSASRSQSRFGAIAASSLPRASKSDMLEPQQVALELDAARAVAADPTGGDDAVAGQEER